MTHRNIKPLSWIEFLVNFIPYAPVAIIYFTLVSGSYALGLAVFSIQMISNSIFQIPTGVFSDWIGRKKTVVLGAVTGAIAIIFYATGINFTALAIGSIFVGLSGALYSGNNQALLLESLKEEKQTKNYQKYAGGILAYGQWALAISAIIGAIIAFYSFSLVLWISVIPQFACIMAAFMITEPRMHYLRAGRDLIKHLKDSLSNFKKDSDLRLLSVASVLDFGIGETTFQFIPAFINLVWPLWAIGIARALSNIGAAIGGHLSHKATKKLGNLKTFVLGGAYGRLAGIIAVVFPTAVSPLLLSSTSLSFGVNTPAVDALFQKKFTDKQRATMGSLTSLAGNLFFGIFAYGFGVLADTLQPAHSILVAEILMIPILFLYWLLFRRKMHLQK